MNRFALSLALSVLLVPGTALAYVEPEDVLYQDDNSVTVGESSSSSSKAAASVSSDDGLHGAAPEESGLTPREERILQRIGNRLDSSAAYVPQQEEALHSGAPLAHTGPESVIALAVVLVAMGVTLFMAKTGRIGSAGK